MEISCQVKGARELARKLRREADQAPKKLSQAVRKVAYDAVDATQTEIFTMNAVDTGNMLGSVDAEISESGDTTTARIGPAGVEYAEWVHEGTWKMDARPFTDKPRARAEQTLTKAAGKVVRL